MSDKVPYDIEQLLWKTEVWGNSHVLLAVSGGADSVAMLRAVLRLSDHPELIDVAHFNHCWRGQESDQDEQFVRELCSTHAVRLYVGRADEMDRQEIGKSEASARRIRYDFLSSVAYGTGARYVLVAHTASDQVETMLHNLFRGTGLAGVRGMSVTRPLDAELVLVRPLLHCSRQQVVDYLKSLGQGFRDDSSNSDQSYRRNYLRHTLLPNVRSQYGDSTDQRLLSFIETAAECDAMLEAMAGDYLTATESLVQDARRQGDFACLDNSMFAFPNNRTQAVSWPVLHQALKAVWIDRAWPLGNMSRKHWQLIRDLHTKSSTSRQPKWQVRENLPGNLQLIESGDWIVVRRVPE